MSTYWVKTGANGDLVEALAFITTNLQKLLIRPMLAFKIFINSFW
jgi:hypothetical protein